MNIQGPKTNVAMGQDELYHFLTDIRNYEKIMPENIEKFEVKTEESFIFQLKGMPVIGLKLGEKTPCEKVELVSLSDKFNFSLTGIISAIDAENSELTLSFDGQFNAMLAMMIKAPLSKFVTTLSENIGKL